MATNVSSKLGHAVRRGVMATVPMASRGHLSGQFQEGETPAPAASASDAAFEGIFATGGSADLGEMYAAAPAAQASPPAEPAPAAGAYQSRAQRFGAGVGIDAGPVPAAQATAQSSPKATPQVAAGEPSAPSAGQTPARPWREYVSPSESRSAVTAKKSMAAAKVLTPLVAAISFEPGSHSSSDAKSKALTSMLVAVHRCAVATAESISEGLKQDVPAWMVTQLMQSLSSTVAGRWQRAGAMDVAALTASLTQLMQDRSEEMSSLIQAASDDAYAEVTHPDIAKFRVSVSAANAAWTLFDWVTHERLSLDPSGDMPSRFFTHGMDKADVVNMMLVKCVDECRALNAQVESADLRTAHLQSSIARMSNLMGAEYVTQTRKVMNWIADPAISDAEYQARLSKAGADFESRIFPLIADLARVNFIRIEQGAFRAIEDLHEKSKAAVSSHDNGTGARPAAQ